MIGMGDMPEGYRLMVASSVQVVIVDADDPALRIKADLEGEGDLWFWVRATREADASRGSVHGRTLYDLMMRHFGDVIVSIVGLWTEGANYLGYREGILRGESPLVAAARTWSGRQAARHGFKAVEVRDESDPAGRLFIKAVFKRLEGSE